MTAEYVILDQNQHALVIFRHFRINCLENIYFQTQFW